MTPIKIGLNIRSMNDATLRNKINFLSYTFCVNADFTKTNEVRKLVTNLEMCTMESLMRVFEESLGYRPYQNKIYEHVENVFIDQDAYNINRMMSSLRRAKLIPINAENKKYLKWMKNRVKYAIKTLMKFTNDKIMENINNNDRNRMYYTDTVI